MKHHETAAGLASLGRYGDTTLVHMSPDEVRSLQRLAEAHGHTLTINPETGLPEAFSLGKMLKSLAPTLLGAAANYFLPGIGGALTGGILSDATTTALLVGGGTALGSGSLEKGLMAGLGAYGGAGLMQGLKNAGTAKIAADAATDKVASLPSVSDEVYRLTGGTLDTKALNAIDPTQSMQALTPEAVAAQATPVSNWDTLKAGLSSVNPLKPGGLGNLTGFAKANLRPLSMAYMGTAGLAAANEAANQGAIPSAAALSNWQFSGDRFNPGTVNPRFGERGQPYFLNRGFTPGPYSRNFQGVTIDQPNAPAPVALATPSNPYAYVGEQAPYNFADGGEVDPNKPNLPVAQAQFTPTLAGPVGPPPQTFTPEQMGNINTARDQFSGMLAGRQGLGALPEYLNNLDNTLRYGNRPAPTPAPVAKTYTPEELANSTAVNGWVANLDGSWTYGRTDPTQPGPGTYSGPAQGVYGTGVNQAYVDSALKQNTPEWQAYAMKGATESQIPQDIRLTNNLTGGDNKMDAADIQRLEVSLLGQHNAAGSDQAMLEQLKAIDPKAYDQVMADVSAHSGKLSAAAMLDPNVMYDELGFTNPNLGGTMYDKSGESLADSYANTIKANQTYNQWHPDYAQNIYSGIDPKLIAAMTPEQKAKYGLTGFTDPTADMNATYARHGIDINAINEANAANAPSAADVQAHTDWFNQTFGAPATASTNTPAANTSTPDTTNSEPDYSSQWYDYMNNYGYGGYGGYPMASGGRVKKMASGGLSSLPEYAAGGKLLDGPGDGMSDSIPAVIKGQQPQRAALADGEFVIPADVVSHLGNGSTKAGSKKLYAMMDKVRMARTGRKAQGRRINPDKFLPV
jgi:hypothetical protein